MGPPSPHTETVEMTSTAFVEPPETPRLHRVTGRTGLGVALTLTTVALWSVLPLGLRIALGGLGAATLTWSRFVTAALVLGTVLTVQGTLPPFRRFGRHDWLLLAVATVFLCINYLLYVLGLDRTNAGTAQVVIQLAPLLLAVGGVFVYGERLRAPQWLGFATMFAGFVLFSYEQISHLVGMLDRYYAGLVYIVLAAIAWAVYGLAQKQLLDRMRPPQVLLCLYVGGALVFAPLAEPARLLRLTPTELAALVFCIANMLGSYGTFAEALVHLEASRVSALLAIVPLSTLASIWVARLVVPSLVAPEPLTPLAVLGAAFVVSGSLAAALGRRWSPATAGDSDRSPADRESSRDRNRGRA
jgi:drug/metabolite transporter (DMT)-like permease